MHWCRGEQDRTWRDVTISGASSDPVLFYQDPKMIIIAMLNIWFWNIDVIVKLCLSLVNVVDAYYIRRINAVVNRIGPEEKYNQWCLIGSYSDHEDPKMIIILMLNIWFWNIDVIVKFCSSLVNFADAYYVWRIDAVVNRIGPEEMLQSVVPHRILFCFIKIQKWLSSRCSISGFDTLMLKQIMLAPGELFLMLIMFDALMPCEQDRTWWDVTISGVSSDPVLFHQDPKMIIIAILNIWLKKIVLSRVNCYWCCIWSTLLITFTKRCSQSFLPGITR